ncbi:acetyltransferase [Vibrio cholerae]|nr:acetyltransferase [Vibrio cholerae]
MVAVVVFEFSVMRCQPLRRALRVLRKHIRNEEDDFVPYWMDGQI